MALSAVIAALHAQLRRRQRREEPTANTSRWWDAAHLCVMSHGFGTFDICEACDVFGPPTATVGSFASGKAHIFAVAQQRTTARSNPAGSGLALPIQGRLPKFSR